MNKKFEKTEIHAEASFLLGCGFHKTKQGGILITDYDHISQTDLEERDLYMFFYRKENIMRTQKISGELFKDQALFGHALDAFEKETREPKN